VFEEPTTQNQSQRNRMDFFRRMRRGGPGGPGDSSSDSGTSEAKTAAVKVTAVGDERSNSVVVSAASEVMLQISTLVKQVDVPTEDDAIVEVFSLKYADAEDTVDVLKEIYSSSDTQDSNVPGQRRFGFFGMRGGPPGMNNNSSSRTLGQADVALVAGLHLQDRECRPGEPAGDPAGHVRRHRGHGHDHDSRPRWRGPYRHNGRVQYAPELMVWHRTSKE
jgi:hypothetical protein